MQTTGFIQIENEIIKILLRPGKLTKGSYSPDSLKLRTTGKDGFHFDVYEPMLKENPELLQNLKEGKVIYL